MTEFTAQLSSLDRVLLHELNHRINNEFAAVIGGVSLAAARSGNKDVKAALTAVTELLQNYAYVHRALQIPEHDTLAVSETSIATAADEMREEYRCGVLGE